MTIYHKASMIHPNGGVSALCFSRPLAINLRKASWTIRNEAVTCTKCLALMKTLNEGMSK